VFSRRERDYLRSVLGPGEAAGAWGDGSPPSLGYRRKLRWSIRRKAERAAVDWELLAAAARKEKDLLSIAPPDRARAIPLYREPLAAAFESLGRRLRRRRRDLGKGGAGP
jgi:hypothetical protein